MSCLLFHSYVLYLSFAYFFVLEVFFFFNHRTAYEMRISDWSSAVCSSDLLRAKAFSQHWPVLAVCGRPSVGKQFLGAMRLLVGAAMCPAFDAALSYAAGHDAFRADLVPTICSHSRCTGQSGFS